MNRAHFSYEDMIFENRNKSYGAYQLRVNYQANLMKSFFICMGGLTLLAFLIYQFNRQPLQKKLQAIDIPIDLTKTFVIDHENIIPKTDFKKISKPNTVAVSKPIVDPLSYKLVQKVVDPIEPAKPEPVTITGAPNGEPIAAVGPAVVPVIGGVIDGLDPGTTVINSAAVDKLPMFPGGMDGFYNFLSKHMRFPDEARHQGISGKLFVSFVINKDGKLVEIEFVKKAGYGMEESVMAVLEKSPKWTPGLVGNQEVNTKMILPVSFNLVQ